jgi:putative ABC transport system permease protein
MIANYLLTAVRNCVTHKLFTFITVGGLAVGLTCTVFILLFVRDELSYDRWIPDSKDLYRVEVSYHVPGRAPLILSEAPFPAGSAMLDQIPEVRGMTRLNLQAATVSFGDRRFPEQVDVVDPQFFQVIRAPLVDGDPAQVFSHPDSAVISQAMAKKYFGSETGILGKTINLSGATCSLSTEGCDVQTHALVITGVLRDLPHNTQLAADILIPNTSGADALSHEEKESWLATSTWAYVRLTPDADPRIVLEKLKGIIDRTVPKMVWAGLGAKSGSSFIAPHLTRFWDDHLSTDRFGSMVPPGNRTTVYGFAVIAILILSVACFNFTNLAIVRATLRAREISLRKVMGARRSQIIGQFLGEAVLMALGSLLLTFALIQPLLPVFDRFLARPIAFHFLANWPLTITILAIALMAGMLSGLYPAVVLSRFKPAATLRTSAAYGTGTGRFRTALVILQFAVSIGLGIAAAVVFAQISYARHIGLGFRTDDVVVIDHGEIMTSASRESFVNTLREHPNIVEVALGTEIPIVSDSSGINSMVLKPGASSVETYRAVLIGPQFISLYGIRLLAGRLLSDNHGEDVFRPTSTNDYGHDVLKTVQGSPFSVLINASAARRLGYTPQQAIGKTFSLFGLYSGTATIVGVVDDIKMGGPKHAAEGTIYFDAPKKLSTFSIRVRPDHLPDTLSFIDKTWAAFAPGFSIRRYFLSDEFNKKFAPDERQGKVFGLFVGIAIFIACLGLFGLAAFTAERRTKEIGIRKTLGAKTYHIVLLLLWQFSIPVLIANIIAWPLAYYYLNGWLQSYPDRITLNPLYFIGAGAVALLIAWATVYAHAYWMARANPIHALRYE